MGKKFFTIVFGFIGHFLVAQPFSQPILIDTLYNRGEAICAADFNGDGFIDLAIAQNPTNSDSIFWYANDGSGNYLAKRLVTTNIDLVRIILAADLNDDGFIDLVSTSQRDNRVAWYENDGTGINWIQHNLTTSAGYAVGLDLKDVDGDGRIDVAYTASNMDYIGWFKNLGNGNFSGSNTIDNNVTSPTCLTVSDIDKDNNMDVASASWQNDVFWYQGSAPGSFGAKQIITNQVDKGRNVYIADLDGDSWEDLISVSNGDDKVAWYKNDGAGGFGQQQIIDANQTYAMTAVPIDLDNDGDVDLISCGYGNSNNYGKVIGFENDGSGVFNRHVVDSSASSFYRGVIVEDLDGDGDLDIATVGRFKTVWFKNQSSISIEESQKVEVGFYPNPMTDLGILRFSKPQFIEKVEILNAIGVKVRRQIVCDLLSEVELERRNLNGGMYLVSIYSQNKNYILRIVIE
jgi:hypothetical protein